MGERAVGQFLGHAGQHRPLQSRWRRHTTVCKCQIKAINKALKEWAAIVEALGRGQQTVVFRKGGIREGVFKPEVRDFLLFPTSFHADGNLLKEELAPEYSQELTFDPRKEADVALKYRATITGAWTTFQSDVVAALSAHHILGPDFLEKRMRWRKQQPISILELQCEQLAEPLILPQSDSFYGCFSWVDLGVTSEVEAVAAIPAAEFERQQSNLRNTLQDLEITELLDL